MLKVIKRTVPWRKYAYPRSKIMKDSWVERYMDRTVFDTPRFRSHLEITAHKTGVPIEKVEFILKHFFIHVIYALLAEVNGISRFVMPDAFVIRIRTNKYFFKNKKDEQSSDAANDGKSE